MFIALLRLLVRAVLVGGLPLSCTDGVEAPERARLTLLHTTDLHSQVEPLTLVVGRHDAELGLGEQGATATVGGFARLAFELERQRERAEAVLHVDTGDLLQGDAVFAEHGGQVEVSLLSKMGVDAQALGNHELDRGAGHAAELYAEHARFPLLAANYEFNDVGGAPSPLADVLQPWTLVEVGALTVALVGVGNASSLGGLDRSPPALIAVPAAPRVQAAVDLLTPASDVVIVLSHLGLEQDERLIAETTGIDVVLGGHTHTATRGGRVVFDCARAELRQARDCRPRAVPLLHSGSQGKYLGRIDLELTQRVGSGLEVRAFVSTLVPLTDEIPELPAVRSELDRLGLEALRQRPVAFAPEPIARRAASGLDSPLGRLICDTLLESSGADVALLNTTGIRADLPAGVVTAADVFAALPFDDQSVELLIEGRELLAWFGTQAERTRSRGCDSTVQLAGARWQLDCPCGGPGCGDRVTLERRCATTQCYESLEPGAMVRVVTSRYLADGGSGSATLARAARVRVSTSSLAQLVIERWSTMPPCAGAAATGAPELGCLLSPPAGRIVRESRAR